MFFRHFNPLLSRSFFLFGARGTGKSTLLESVFRSTSHLQINLLDRVEEDKFRTNPSELEDRLGARRDGEWVLVDEIQKIPALLDDVQRFIKRFKFALTGSSARKLKDGGANLLAGRASVYSLFPLTFLELGEQFDLFTALNWGSLPEIFLLGDELEREQFLESYALTYLKEEVWGEHLVRNLDPFRSFLSVAAQMNGKLINYTKIARDVGVDPKTVQSYYQILTDTLLGFLLVPFHRSIRKRQKQSPKFYFFDPGVVRALAGTLSVPVIDRGYNYGNFFEHFVINEIYKLNAYQRHSFELSFIRTENNVEIDLLIERAGKVLWAVEIKSSDRITSDQLKHISHLGPEINAEKMVCLSNDKHEKFIDDVHCLYWRDGINMIFEGAEGLSLHEIFNL
ncbi:MAG: ATP-binding protein [Bdellovibrionales bacterium]|nr:ATP-binding protein [Bdellovibrionales bacterium]